MAEINFEVISTSATTSGTLPIIMSINDSSGLNNVDLRYMFNEISTTSLCRKIYIRDSSEESIPLEIYDWNAPSKEGTLYLYTGALSTKDVNTFTIDYSRDYTNNEDCTYNTTMSGSYIDDVIVYDVESSWLETYVSGTLSPWANRIELSISNSDISETLLDFPVLVNISEESGVNVSDCSSVFTELEYDLSSENYTFVDTFSGTALNSVVWTVEANTDAYDVSTQDGCLVVDVSDTETGWTKVSLSTNFFMYDFDIELQYEDFDNDNDHYFILELYNEVSDTILRVGPRYYYSNYLIMYTYQLTGTSSTTDNNDTAGWADGFVRIVRSGSTATAYYKHYEDDDWTTVFSGNVGDDKVYPSMFAMKRYAAETSFISYIKYFRVNSGGIHWDTETFINKQKIAITSADGITQLPVEIENWDQYNKSTQLWTKVPVIRTDEATKLYLYYDVNKPDNTDYVGSTTDAITATVWDDDYKAVYHLNDTNIYDSSQYRSHGTGTGLDSTNIVDANVGKALQFNGSNEYVTLDADVYNFDANSFTIEARYYIMESDLDCHITKYNATATDNSLHMGRNSKGYVLLGFYSDDVKLTTNSPADNTWFTLAGTYDYNTTIQTIILDGTYKATDTSTVGVLNTDDDDIIFPTNSTADNLAYATMKEIRISDTVRSENWLEISHKSTTDNLITYGAEETYTVESDPEYYFHGYTTANGKVVVATVILYDSSTGERVDSTTSSSSDGYYLLSTYNNTEHFIIATYEDNIKMTTGLYPNGE